MTVGAGRSDPAARRDRSVAQAVPRLHRPARKSQTLLMKRLTLIGIFVALLLAIVAIAATWSTVTPVNPAVAPDTSSTPNPTAQRK